MSAIAFLGTYADWKLIKTRGVVQIVVEIPLHEANKAYETLGGMPDAAAEVWCGVTRIDPSKIAGNAPLLPEAPAREAGDSKAAPPAPASHLSPDKKFVQHIGMICAERQFVDWYRAYSRQPDATAENAIIYVRKTCRVLSRSEIKPGTEAAKQWDWIEAAYICWKEKDRYVAA